jgi:hypothetical protein
MLKDRESKLKLYSMGIVVADKHRGTDIIEIYPVEELPLVNGKIEDYKQDYKVSLPNAKGGNVSGNIKGGATIQAKWIPYGQNNRVTPPDVIRNETVLIFKYADTDTYYWTTAFNEPGIRRQETVTYMYGNIPTPLIKFDKNTSYWFEVSTHDKSIKLHTSSNDGEACEYDIILDTGAGTFTLKDSLGNIVVLDSPGGNLTANINTLVTATVPDAILNANVVINGTLTVRDAVTMESTLQVADSINADTVGASGSMTAPVFNGNLNGSDGD